MERGRYGYNFSVLGQISPTTGRVDRCTLNRGAFAFKIVGGTLKWPLKGGSRLIQVTATAGLTVVAFHYQLYLATSFNPLLHRLFLDHDIIFYFSTTFKKFKRILSKVLNTFESIMVNIAFVPKEHLSKCSIFHNIFKYMTKGVIME